MTIALVITAGDASAEVIPQRSIMGVTLGMKKATVRAKLGRPDAIGHPPNEIGGGNYTLYRYGKTRIYFYDSAPDEIVAFIRTGSRSERTTAGVGVGSNPNQVLRGVRGSKCRDEFGLFHCWVGEWRRAGRKVTDFTISRKTGRVSEIFLGYVQD